MIYIKAKELLKAFKNLNPGLLTIKPYVLTKSVPLNEKSNIPVNEDNDT